MKNKRCSLLYLS